MASKGRRCLRAARRAALALSSGARCTWTLVGVSTILMKSVAPRASESWRPTEEWRRSQLFVRQRVGDPAKPHAARVGLARRRREFLCAARWRPLLRCGVHREFLRRGSILTRSRALWEEEGGERLVPGQRRADTHAVRRPAPMVDAASSAKTASRLPDLRVCTQRAHITSSRRAE